MPNPSRALTEHIARARMDHCPALVLALAMSLTAADSALAQTPVGNGRLGGVVSDTVGNPVVEATVTLTQLSTQAVVEVTTDDKGRFRKGGLGSGRWNVDVTASGFLPKTLSATVRDRSNQNFEVTLEHGESIGAPGNSLFAGKLGEKISAANALYDAGNYAVSLAALDVVISEEMAKPNPDPNIHLVHINSGNAAFEMNSYEVAARHYKATLAVDRANHQARMGMAKVYLMRRDIDAAIEELKQVDLSSITDPIVFYNIGNLLFGQGQPIEAQGFFEMALGLNPNDVDSHMQAALCLIQQGKMEESRGHLQKVIELDPESSNGILAHDFLNTIG